MELKQRLICRRAVNHYGKENQKKKCIEEMAELTKALCKETFVSPDEVDGNLINIQEEIADVIIMANQMRIIYGPDQVDAAIEYKLNRLKGKMEVKYE